MGFEYHEMKLYTYYPLINKKFIVTRYTTFHDLFYVHGLEHYLCLGARV